MRLFVAVSPSAEVLGRIEQSLHSLRLRAPSAKWVKVDNMHLTLAFLGERDAADVPKLSEALSGAASKHAPFELCFRGGGGFGRPSRPRILWAGCEGDTAALAALQKDVEAALVPLGYVAEQREYNAHLTLARAKEQGGDFKLAGCIEVLEKADFGVTRVEEVTLYESRLSPGGARYEALHRAPLESL